jgi:hypothetical protein
LIPDVSATLLCAEWLVNELSEFHESLGQVKEPVAVSESEDSGLVRDYGLLAVPLDLSKEEAELLIAEAEDERNRAQDPVKDTNGLICRPGGA